MKQETFYNETPGSEYIWCSDPLSQGLKLAALIYLAYSTNLPRDLYVSLFPGTSISPDSFPKNTTDVYSEFFQNYTYIPLSSSDFTQAFNEAQSNIAYNVCLPIMFITLLIDSCASVSTKIKWIRSQNIRIKLKNQAPQSNIID